MRRIVICFLLVLLCLSAIACGTSPGSNAGTNVNSNTSERVCDPISDTPTEAYKRLYAAVKDKGTDRIKGEMSQKTHQLVEMMAQRQKQSPDEVFANGLTGTTFAPSLPEIRDPRVAGCWAAVEVRNDKDQRWEDIPFVNEGGAWKLAFGEMFSGAFKSPGKGMDIKEKEAANAARGGVPVVKNPYGNISNVNANTNSSSVPRFDGPQVEPLNKKR